MPATDIVHVADAFCRWAEDKQRGALESAELQLLAVERLGLAQSRLEADQEKVADWVDELSTAIALH
jgi:hypothetical protein